MNDAFDEFLALPDNERRDVFNAAAERLDTLSSYIEKDFWVCKVLDALYHGRSPDHPRLLFKGGTSLSKAFNAIYRFSEDIDMVVFRDDLGFIGDNDPTAEDLSGKKRARLTDKLRIEASNYICGDLATCLKTLLNSCTIIKDTDDPDSSTLLVQYQSLYEGEPDAYVAPRIKIEGGSRSALDPRATQHIFPYIQDELQKYDLRVPDLLVLEPERTLLEKVLILHSWHCGYRDQQREPEDRHRLSRHYYDVGMMAHTDIADRAVNDPSLLETVRNHSLAFFRSAWMRLEEAVPGSLHLSPQENLATKLRRDYAAMQGMILGDAPSFDSILEAIAHLEGRLNGQT